jgi:hypothetical protein
MGKEWIVLYIIIIGSALYLARVIRSSSYGSRDDSDHGTLERIEEEISKIYDNSLRDDMEPYDQFVREENPPTIYDIVDALQSIDAGIDDIAEKLEESELSKND